jgi:anti-repressor protein
MEIEKFKNEEFGIELHSAFSTKRNEALFFAKEVCEMLGIQNPTKALQNSKLNLGVDYDVITKKNGVKIFEQLTNLKIVGSRSGSFTVLYESGLYALILNSRKKEAIDFRNWVTRDVLPSIRKHGAYMTPTTIDDMINNPDMAIKLLTTLKKEREEKQKIELELKESQKKVEELIPNKIFTDNFFLSPEQELFSLHQTAQLIGKGCGRTTLINKLREKEILQQKSLKPMQQYLDRGWFQIKITSHRKDDKYPQTFVTRKGFGHICKVLGIVEPNQLSLFN